MEGKGGRRRGLRLPLISDTNRQVMARQQGQQDTELVFLVEEAAEGGYTARALGQSVFTQAETRAELVEAVRDAVRCHFEREADQPKIIRLHYDGKENPPCVVPG
jgi:predicted RNase H-like HicB family nuclease